MAVTRHIETTVNREASDKASPFTANRSRSFSVRTDSLESEDTIANHASTPQLGDSHPDSSFSICSSRKFNQDANSPLDWLITCQYTTDWETVETETDPLLFRPQVTWGTQYVQRPLVVDAADSSKKVLNTAGDPFDPPVMTDRPLTTCSISMNVAAIPSWIFSLRNKVNNAALTIRGVSIAEELALLRNLTISDDRYKNGTLYFRVEIELLIDEDGHKVKILNDGLHELDVSRTGTEKRTHIMFDGEPISQPIPLDVDGKAISSDDLPDSALILEFVQYPPADFSVLNLPA